MSFLAVLGIARVGRVATLVGVVAVASSAAGFWSGSEWNKGRRALDDVSTLRADADVLRAAANETRRRSLEAAQDMRTNARRMDAIATEHAESVDALDHLYARQEQLLRAQLASADAVDLVACRIGALGLQVWAEAARGLAADASTRAADAGAAVLAPAVPDDAADPTERQRAGSVVDLAARGTPVPPLPRAAGVTGQGGRHP